MKGYLLGGWVAIKNQHCLMRPIFKKPKDRFCRMEGRLRARIDRKICSRFCLCKKKAFREDLLSALWSCASKVSGGQNEGRVLSTAYRSACVFLQADCPQIHRVILRLKFNAKFGQIRYKKAHPANPHSIRVDFSGSLLGKPYIIATAHHKNQNKRLYRPIL